MRIRSIKPEFFLDEELAQHPPLERLLFEALWLQADKAGRLEDRPAKIKAQALPYDQCDVGAMLQHLHDGGFIARYEVDGKALIQVTAFEKHQRPNHREVVSTLPAVPRHAPARPGKRVRPNPGKPGQDREEREGERTGKGMVDGAVVTASAGPSSDGCQEGNEPSRPRILAPPVDEERLAWERECYALVRQLAARDGRDGAELWREHGTFTERSGRVTVKPDPAAMTRSRLFHTLDSLRRAWAGEAAEPAPVDAEAEQEAQERAADARAGRA